MKDLKNQKISILALIILFTIHTSSEESKFVLNQPNIPTKSTNDKPLFELLNSNPPKMLESNSTRWGNNPFFSAPKPGPNQARKERQSEPQEMTIFEYKVSAIWEVNNEYKALVSGHIVKKGDQINDLTISNISKDKIFIRRKNRKKVFRLGSVFYDFQI